MSDLNKSIKRDPPGKTFATSLISPRATLWSQPPLAIKTALNPSFNKSGIVKSKPDL